MQIQLLANGIDMRDPVIINKINELVAAVNGLLNMTAVGAHKGKMESAGGNSILVLSPAADQ